MRYKRGQSTVEVAVFLTTVVAALVCMSVYMKRGIQGHLRAVAGKITPEATYTYEKLRLRPEVLSDKLVGRWTEEDVKLPLESKGDFAYSRGNTAGSTQRQTLIREYAESQGRIVTSENITSKTTNRQEFILP